MCSLSDHSLLSSPSCVLAQFFGSQQFLLGNIQALFGLERKRACGLKDGGHWREAPPRVFVRPGQVLNSGECADKGGL